MQHAILINYFFLLQLRVVKKEECVLLWQKIQELYAEVNATLTKNVPIYRNAVKMPVADSYVRCQVNLMMT